MGWVNKQTRAGNSKGPMFNWSGLCVFTAITKKCVMCVSKWIKPCQQKVSLFSRVNVSRTWGRRPTLGGFLMGPQHRPFRIRQGVARTVMWTVISSLVLALTLIFTRVPRKPTLFLFLTVTHIVEYLYIFWGCEICWIVRSLIDTRSYIEKIY